MKASISIGSEIDIDLSVDELSRLKRETLKVTAKVCELSTEFNPLREIELSLGELQSNLFVEMKSLPKGACFEEFEKYKDIILEKTKRNKEEVNDLLRILKKKIKTISNEELIKLLHITPTFLLKTTNLLKK